MNKKHRRKALKALAAAAPAVWAKPAVDTVILPAHATTTTCNCTLFDGDRISVVSAGTCGSSLPTWEIRTWFDPDSSCSEAPDDVETVVAGLYSGTIGDGCDCEAGEQFMLPCGDFTGFASAC